MRSPASLPFRLQPLAAAVLAALPWLASAQPRPAAPAVNALPVPAAAGWRVFGQGGTWNPNAATGQAVIDQTSRQAIYQWQSFDIGKSASLTYQFSQRDGAALNRVLGGDPSRIFGTLRSTVPGANGSRETGGTLLLINKNGILFGEGARVNTGSFFASALNAADDDFRSGLTSIGSTDPTFRHDGGAELFTDARSFVRVDAGAEITTANGGRVFLFAKNVDSAGTIRTPGGQTVLAGGESVYLNDPSAERIYASEANPEIPALRGLLVEVGGAAGAVQHSGTIETPRGNATLVGLAVNQSGTIRATTSVTENGSVFLLARGGTATNTDGFTTNQRATVGGQLTLGENSRIEIRPDAPEGTTAPATIDGNATFTQSRIELSGQTVLIGKNSTIEAPAAVLNVRAEDVPSYAPNTKTDRNFETNSATARIAIAEGASIDVSGTTDTQVSVARNFVTTELIGGADLADSPLQRNGPIARSRITFDVREGAPILSDSSIEGYRNTVRTTANERMASGGSVSLFSTGSVATHERSTIDVSGGAVTFTAAAAQTSMLVAADGRRLSIGDAPKDVLYTAIEGRAPRNGEGVLLQDRWGALPQWTASRARVEPGYVEGRSGGSLNVLGRQAVLDGRLVATTTLGPRQRNATDAPPAPSSLELGRRILGDALTGSAFGSSGFGGAAALGDFSLVGAPASLGDAFWTNPLAALPSGPGRIAARTVNDAGFAQVYITSTGTLTQAAGADLAVPEKGRIEWRTTGDGGITLDADTRGAGATVLAQTADVLPGQLRGDVRVGSDATIDVAGTWVNRRLDGAAAPAAVGGGSVQLLSAHGLTVAAGSSIDVSGGVTVSSSGVVSGTGAGRIALESNRFGAAAAVPASAMTVDGVLRGFDVAQGGALRVRGAEVDITAAATLPLAAGANPASLRLAPGFFDDGGFASYDIEGASRLTVHAGTLLAPRSDNWQAGSSDRDVATGARPSQVLDTVRLPDALRRPVSLSLSSSGLRASEASGPEGALSVERGATLAADPGARVSLSANARLDFDGRLDARAGQATLALRGVGWNGGGDSSTAGFAGTFHIGEGAVIDTSAVAIATPTTDGTRQGRMLDAGAITLTVSDAANAARQTRIDVAPGAALVTRGARETFSVAVQGPDGRARQDEAVIGAPGSIVVNVQQGGARLDGRLDASSVDASVLGGRLAITQPQRRGGPFDGDALEQSIRIAAGPLPVVDAAERGTVRISADALNAGNFGDISLRTPQRVHFDGSVTVDAARRVALDAAVVSAAPGADVLLAAPSLRLSAPVTAPFAAPGDTAYAASGGDARLVVAGGLVELAGPQTLQGIGTFTAAARSHIELQGVLQGSLQPGALRTQANVTLSAPQTTVSTLSSYTIDAPDRLVRFTEGRSDAAPVLSAGGALTVNAGTILQDGVLRAPLGTITFNASDEIALSAGSLTSVSGAGLTVPFGVTSGGRSLSYLGQSLEALPAKSITLAAATGRVGVDASARLDLSAGGTAQATEFVPGPGGSIDAFAGAAGGAFAVVPTVREYAPFDAQTAVSLDAAGNAASIATGRTITFAGNAGPIAAGTYAVLPARYALLPGAFLVTPAGAQRVQPGTVQRQADGSALVGATLGIAGTLASSAGSGFVVRTGEQARQLSEVRIASADAVVADAARQVGRALPRLAQDAGTLNIAARQLALDGAVAFDRVATPLAETTSRGGNVAISAQRITLGDASATTDTLRLTPEQLNALNAESLTLGALRRDQADGTTTLEVGAERMEVGRTAQPLRSGDIVLAATDTVSLAAGAQIAAAGNVEATTLTVAGDGALLRLSADADAASTRSGVSRSTGTLQIAEAVTLEGASLTAEATARTRIAEGARIDARVLNFGAPKIAVVDATAAAAPLGDDTLQLSVGLSQRIGAAERVTLRSFDSIDFYGTGTQLGGAALQSLTLDAATLRLAGDNSTARVSAGAVTLLNSSGSIADAAAGSGSLQIDALRGDLTLGPGNVGVAGSAQAVLGAQRSVVFDGSAAVSVGGDASLVASSVTARQRADATLAASGSVRIESSVAGAPASERAAAGVGARLALKGASVAQDGTVELPSGVLGIEATAGPVQFGARSQTLLQGRRHEFDGRTVGTAGGDVRVAAQGGDVRMAEGAVVDVSAGAAGAHAGSVGVSAANGAIALDGTLRGTSQRGDGLGATLSLDSAAAADLDQLAARIADGRSATQDNFARRIEVRNREGDQRFSAGSVLSAEQIGIAVDRGALELAGTLDASGVQGGELRAAVGGDLRVAGTAVLRANAGGGAGNLGQGGEIALMTSGGRIAIDAGSTLEARDGNGAASGALLLRTPRVGVVTAADAGTEVAVDALAGNLNGVGRIEVEAVKVYTSAVNTTVNAAFIGTVTQDNAAFAGVDGAQAAAMASRLTQGDAALAARTQLRPGVEVRASGNLTVASDWNLTALDASGNPVRPSGAPMNLTLRAGGNVTLNNTVSDGFESTTPAAAVSGEGGAIRVIGGADLAAADLRQTSALDPSAAVVSGNVTLGRNNADVLLRSSTGAVEVAAAGDVRLLNARAAVYTTGMPVTDAARLAGYEAPATSPANAFLRTDSGTQSPMLSGGSDVSVRAGRDVIGAPDAAQSGMEWWWRGLNPNDAASWYARYDRFRQGFGALGGGDVHIAAGRDAVAVQASAPPVGFFSAPTSAGGSALSSFAGGRVQIEATRDISGAWAWGGGDRAVVRAGRDITADDSGVQVLHGNTAVDVSARGNVHVGLVTEPGLLTPSNQWSSNALASFRRPLTGFGTGSALSVSSDAGDAQHLSAANATRHPALGSSNLAAIAPAQISITAPEGSATLARDGKLVQLPIERSSLFVAARDDVVLGSGPVFVGGAQPFLARPAIGVPLTTERLLDNPLAAGSDAVQAGEAAPLRVIARDGDITVNPRLATTTPLRMIAGGDIRQFGGSGGSLDLQHTDDRQLSLLQAGGTIALTLDNVVSGGTVNVHGPGDLVVLAGGSIDLGASGGIVALGNRQNAALPPQSARLTVVAGVAFDRGDYHDAVDRYSHVLGGNGIVGSAVTLAADLAPGGPAFDTLTPAQQLERARSIAGSDGYDASLLRFMRLRSGDDRLDLAAAQTAAATLEPAQQAALAANVISDAWLARTPADAQAARVAELAAAQPAPGKDQPANADTLLLGFIERLTGVRPTLADAIRQFNALAPERQVLLLNAVLANDLRRAGRNAAQARTDQARDAAYGAGLAALDALFPTQSPTLRRDVLMGSSQIKTLQGSELTLMAPRGGVNVGQLTAASTAKSSSELGIVTAGGGAVNVAVRDSVEVNRSRVFTVGKGDLLMWASTGDIDAGRGAKTVTGAPPPVYRVGPGGVVVVDTSGSYAGSGIAVLDESSTLDLYAPRGTIDAGDAGITSAGNAFLGAARFVGGDNLQVGGVAVGAPPPPPAAGGTAGLAGVGQAATSAGSRATTSDEEEERRKRRQRRELLLDFLGFGERR